ncbi:hypothetical protein HPB48_019527 [Haemaphysalis longicornis]|uniref:Uncharacterized protein n=1 Tax=Haemaphysalis longicornis TaxID=44386 RepID=A0A9J6FAM5_HAELO|nr:hypothetical protein HPB48_019527 [Haemaphysalis longicornis]
MKWGKCDRKWSRRSGSTGCDALHFVFVEDARIPIKDYIFLFQVAPSLVMKSTLSPGFYANIIVSSIIFASKVPFMFFFEVNAASS